MPLRVACAQVNPVAGDLEGNLGRILEAARRAREAGAGALLLPSMALPGGPAGDWLEQPEFQGLARGALARLAAGAGLTVVIGCECPGVSLITVQAGEIKLVAEGERAVVDVGGVRAGLMRGLDAGFAAALKEDGAQALLASCSERYAFGGRAAREAALSGLGLPAACVNLVGGEDAWVYDGASFAAGADGKVRARLASFEEDFAVFDLMDLPAQQPEAGNPGRELYAALVLAVRDYVRKSGFSDVQIGLSGGVDSALVAAIAADALGPEHVWCLMMPTRHTAGLSLTEAGRLAANLGVHYAVRPIAPALEGFRALLAEDFAGLPRDVTEENLQARVRGVLLMAHANKFGRLVLATGNKSEGAAGYCTLYGDTVGAFAPIKDVLKTQVWALCRLRNAAAGRELIPEAIIGRAPSAELSDGQFDQQSLPPYEVLDAIVRQYVEEGRSIGSIAAGGIDRALVARVAAMIERGEYKRRQCPLGPIVSRRGFGGGWRRPVVWRGPAL
ncbi:MAG: NAD(+) synthase [Duodenibacillus sp.]|nr:NAD(+) synthase [Duodenibacillus sp.]